MLIAVDRNSKELMNKYKEHKFIYIFENETLEDLSKIDVDCYNIKHFNSKVDINVTKYNIDCIKTTDLNDKNLLDIPFKKDYKFALIIPNFNNDHGEYNGKTYFQNCIESVLNQTYKDFKLIIIDDMSTDTSVDTVKSYKDDRIILIQNKRKHYNGGSRNVGIEYVVNNLPDTDYIGFLDSDDWWKHSKVLETINNTLYDDDMLMLGLECINKDGIFLTKINQWDNDLELFESNNKVWCTSWSRIIKKDKIAYFCEDTLMEDRVWSYRQTNNINTKKVRNLKEVCYVWNRMNTSNSVSLTRSPIWDYSAYCHIGHQGILLQEITNPEYRKFIEQRIKECKSKVNNNTFMQY